MLARERSAEADDEIGGLLDEGAIVPDALGCLQGEVDAGVHAALAEVAVETALEAVLVEQVAEAPQALAETLRRYGRVFPPLPGRTLTVDVGGGAEARLPNLPDLLFLVRVVEKL